MAALPEYMKSIVTVALNTGMRRAEIVGLTWARVDLMQRRILLVETKGGRKRMIPMNRTVTDLLGNLKPVSHSEFVFAESDRRCYDSVTHAFASAVKQAGIPHMRLHDIRHTFASRLLMKRVPLITVSRILGHATIALTADQYGHLTEEHELEAVSVLDETANSHQSRVLADNLEVENVVSAGRSASLLV